MKKESLSQELIKKLKEDKYLTALFLVLFFFQLFGKIAGFLPLPLGPVPALLGIIGLLGTYFVGFVATVFFKRSYTLIWVAVAHIFIFYPLFF